MAITLRQSKGAPLTHTELDANFSTLDSATSRPLNYLAGDSDIDFGTHKILYSNNYDSLGALPSAGSYHGMFAHVHGEGKAYYAHGGAWIKLSDYDDRGADSVGALSNVNMTGIADNKILKWDSASQNFIVASDIGGGGAGISLSDLSVTQNAAGSAALSYNNGNGIFSYTPPDLSSYTANALDSATFHTKLTTNYSLNEFDSATFHTKLTTNYASDFKGAGFDSATFHTKLTGNYSLGGGGGGGSGAYDLNGAELTIDADGDTTIHADTDDQIDFKVGGSDVVRIKTDGLYVDEVKSLSAGTPTVTSSSNIVLSAAGSVTVTQNSGGGGFRVGSLTTTNRGSLSASDGEIIYNTTNSQFEIYQNSAWHPMTKGAAIFNVGNNGASDYTFSDPENHWFPSSENDPQLYLRRGETYYFVVNASGHPFQIRQSNGGSAYSTGVSNNGTQVGTVTFKVPMSAPSTLYYQCTAHSGMGNTINIV